MTVNQLVPALLAGLIAIAVTIAIERLGGRLGGILGTIPSSIVPASIGLWQSSPGTADFQATLAVMPVGLLLNVGFLYLWRTVPRHLPGESLGGRLGLMSALSLGAWFVAAFVSVATVAAMRAQGMPLDALGWTMTGLIALSGIAACWQPRAAPRGRRKVGPGTLLVRGVLASAAVLVAIVMAEHGGALAAGVATVFPAIFLTTMVALWLAQGEAVPAGAVGPMMLGASSTGVYAMVAVVTIPALGPAAGALIAWLVAVLGASLPAWTWLRTRRTPAERAAA